MIFGIRNKKIIFQKKIINISYLSEFISSSSIIFPMLGRIFDRNKSYEVEQMILFFFVLYFCISKKLKNATFVSFHKFFRDNVDEFLIFQDLPQWYVVIILNLNAHNFEKIAKKSFVQAILEAGGERSTYSPLDGPVERSSKIENTDCCRDNETKVLCKTN